MQRHASTLVMLKELQGYKITVCRCTVVHIQCCTDPFEVKNKCCSDVETAKRCIYHQDIRCYETSLIDAKLDNAKFCSACVF